MKDAAAPRSLCDRIDAQLAQAGTAAFLVVDGKVIARAAFNDRMLRCFSLFASLGLGPGDRVAVLSADVCDVATLMLAGLRAGIGMINLNPGLSAKDAKVALTACSPQHVFMDDEIRLRLTLPAGLAFSRIGQTNERPGGGLLARLQARAPQSGLSVALALQPPAAAPAAPALDDVAMMLFTSGTTSAPKVVVLTHGNLSAQIDAFLTVFDHDAGSRVLNPLPLHFTDGMLHGPILCYVTGASLYRPTRFEFTQIEDLMHSIWRDRITHFVVVPALLSLIDRLGDAFADAFAAPDFRYLRSSGDLLPELLWRSIESRFGVRVVNTYGMSETVCEATYCGPDDASHRIGTIGKAVGCKLRILDDDGVPVAAGAVGDLQIAGPIVMHGYLDQPELTTAALTDGWLRTGDLATQDADGFVRIVGRRKTLIITGGVNVHPQDVTDALLTHPAVAEAVTLGLPHAMWGEQIAAAVVLRPGMAASPRDLTAHCEGLLTAHKLPRVLSILPNLPRNPAGKVVLADIRAMLEGLDTSRGSSAETNLAGQIIALAATTFGADATDLRLGSTPATTLGWDSLSHLNLILAAERHFSVRMTASDVLRLQSIEDFVTTIARLRAV